VSALPSYRERRPISAAWRKSLQTVLFAIRFPQRHIARDMRLVVDTTVLVTAFRSPTGAAAEVVRLVRRRAFTMLATVALFLEYAAVLTRQEHLARAKMTAAEANNALDVLAAVVEPVESHFLWRPRLRDPDDDMSSRLQ
jgi:predicted nucleic acid-binding protein